MKSTKLIPLVLLAVMISLTGCKKGPEKLIVQTWKVTNIMTKGVVNDSIFELKKAELLKVEMTFKDNKYTMSSGGNIIESGTYAMENGVIVLKTELGMRMNATVTKENLTLDTPDFIATLLPK